MAVLSGYQLPTTGGNSKNKPLWQQLGYSSEQAYLNAMGGNTLLNYVDTPSVSKYPTGEVVSPTVSMKTGTNGDVTQIAGNKVEPVQGTFVGNYQSPATDVSSKEDEKTPTEKGNEPVSVGNSEKDKWNEYYDKKAEELINSYSTAKESLDKNKRTAEQNASITYDKLKKYLPMQIKAQGLDGLGVSESAMLQAHNNYANQMGEIARNYSADMATLDSDKISKMNELDGYRMEKMDEIEAKEEEKTTSRQNSLYNEYSTQMDEAFGYTLIGSDGKVSKADYDAWGDKIEGWREAIGEDNYALMKAQYDGYSSLVRNDVDEKQTNEQISREEIIDKWKLGVGDGEYTVHSDYGGGFSLGNGMKVKIKDGDEGMSLDTFAYKAGKSGSAGLNSGEAGWWGGEKKNSKAIAKLAKEGKLENGTIVDTNRGDGAKYWVYINGYFYRVEITQ